MASASFGVDGGSLVRQVGLSVCESVTYQRRRALHEEAIYFAATGCGWAFSHSAFDTFFA
jgi:hypothetical protein